MADDVGSLLLRAGLVEPDQLEHARKSAKSHGGTVPEDLVRRKHVSDEDLTSFYRSRLLIPRISPSELTRLPTSLLEKVPADMAIEFRSIPVSLDSEGNLTLAMSDPCDTKAAEEISFFTGSYVMRAVATQAQIAWCLAHYYKQETDLYRQLVAEGVWPDSANPEENAAPQERSSDQQTAPMKTRPRPVTQKARKPRVSDSSEEEPTTGPLKTRVHKRPANQHPSPPELFARAGEIQSVVKPDRMLESEPGVQICLDEVGGAEVKSVQRGTDTAPILLSSIKAHRDAKARDTGPIILDETDRKRRVSRRTSLGVGVGADGPPSAASPIQEALAAHAESGPVAISSGPSNADGNGAVANRGESTEPDFGGRSVSPTDETLPDSLAGKLRNLPTPKGETARSVDLVGGDWGEPGTTIPPSFLGAGPQAYEGLSDSVPIAIDDNEDVTSQINIGKDSVPTEFAPPSDTTDRSDVPTAITQGNRSEAASRLLSALRSIDRAEDKHGILDPVLTFLDSAFERTGFLALRQDELSTWILHGCMDDAKSSFSIELDSSFKDVVRTRLPYNGPIEDGPTKQLARDLDMPDALDLLALPVTIRDRVIGVLFGMGSYDSLFEDNLTILTQAVGEAFERLLLARK